MNCPFCNSDKVRNSRFRAADISELVFGRLPVRCRTCQERSYVSILQARHIRVASQLRRQEHRIPGNAGGSAQGPP
jgi:hypothetical protein